MPGTELGKAYVQIIPTAKGISSGIEGLLDEPLTKEGHAGGKKLGAGIATGLKAASAAVIAGTAALSAAITKGVADTAAYGDNVDKMSQKMGLSAEAYQEWDAIMQHSGTSIDSLQSGMKTLANAVESGNGAFERLGITQEQVASMSNEDLFAATISSLQNVENETERTYLAGQLLGRGATELGPLLNMSAEETEAMRQRVHELGGVMSNDAVKAAAAYQDSLQDMKTALSGASRNILSEFMPSITTVMDGMTELFAGGDGIGLINDGITDFINKLSANIPKILNVGGNIVVTLVNAIIQNLPALISAAIPVLQSLVGAIIENLPVIIDAALNIIMALAQGLIDALPVLIPAIVDVVFAIAEKLTEPDTLMMLVEAVFQIIGAIVVGIVNSLPRILEGIGQVIFNAIGFIYEALSPVIDGIADIFSGAWEGIKNAFSSVGNFFSGVWQSIKNAFGSVAEWFRGIFSRAWQAVKNVFSSGGRIFTGIKEGIERAFKNIVNAIIRGINKVVAIPFNAINGILNTLRGVDILGIKPFGWIRTISVPQIPQLAKGGIVDDPTLAVVGEAGDEAVVPLDKLWREMRSMWADTIYNRDSAGAGGIGNMTINIYATDGQNADDIADAVMLRIQEATERRAAALA